MFAAPLPPILILTRKTADQHVGFERKQLRTTERVSQLMGGTFAAMLKSGEWGGLWLLMRFHSELLSSVRCVIVSVTRRRETFLLRAMRIGEASWGDVRIPCGSIRRSRRVCVLARRCTGGVPEVVCTGVSGAVPGGSASVCPVVCQQCLSFSCRHNGAAVEHLGDTCWPVPGGILYFHTFQVFGPAFCTLTLCKDWASPVLEKC